MPCKDNTGVDLPPDQYLATTYNDGEFDWFDKLIHHHPTAVIKGGLVNITFTLHRPASEASWSGTLSLNPTYNGSALYGSGPQSISVPSGGNASVTFSVGPFPNVVKPKKTLICTLVPSPNNVSIWGADSTPVTEPVYLVHATPTAPQVKPWLGVLDDACAWAEGENAHDSVARELTTGLYFSPRFVYPADGNARWADPLSATTFQLSDFLADIAVFGTVNGNCVDVSDYLVICANAVGLIFEVAQYRDSSGEFQTNPICLIGGLDPTDWSNYRFIRWGMHQIAHPKWGSSVYDACEAQWRDPYNGLWQNPPFGWPLDDFWQTGGRLGFVYEPFLSTRVPGTRYVPSVN